MLEEYLQADAMNIVRSVISNVYRGSAAYTMIAAISIFWTVGKGVLGIMSGLNNIYHLRENRNYLILRLQASLYALLLIVLVVMALWFMFLGGQFQTTLHGLFPRFRIYSATTRYVRLLIASVLAIGILDAMYVLLPNLKQSPVSQFPGAVFTTIGWLVFAKFFSIYLTHASTWSVLYGGLLTIVVAMFWIYFLIYIFFVGAEVNVYLNNPDSFPV